MVWLQFIICIIIILIAGSKTAQYADIIAEKTRLGRLWVGVLILAMVTSMPELVTSVSSVAVVHDPNLSLSTLIGTSIFNLCILAVLDIVHRGKPVLSIASRRHFRALLAGILLAIVIGTGILFDNQLSNLNFKYVGLPSILVLFIYLVMLWRLVKERRETPPDASLLKYDRTSGRHVWLKFVISSLAIIGSGIWLSIVGEEIIEVTGWGASFVGSLLMAITTSLPELTVVFASVRLGAIDLAVGDVLGANMLDLTYLFVIDLTYGRDLILSYTSRSNLVTLVLLVVMYIILGIAFRFPAQKKLFGSISWYAPVLIALYIIGAYILFITSTNI